MRMERRRSSLTPCWPRLEAGDTRLEVEEPIFQLEQVSGTREPAARDQEAEDTSLPHHHWQRWRPRQVSTRSKCIILSYKRAPYQNIYREITPTPLLCRVPRSRRTTRSPRCRCRRMTRGSTRRGTSTRATTASWTSAWSPPRTSAAAAASAARNTNHGKHSLSIKSSKRISIRIHSE